MFNDLHSFISALDKNRDLAPIPRPLHPPLAIPAVTAPASMQGHRVRALVEGRPAPADWRTATYYRYWMHMTHHDNPAHYGVRTKDFKLIFFYGLPLDAKGALPTPTT